MLVEKGIDRVFDPDKIVVTPDHFQPAKDIKSAELHKRLDEWAKRHKIKHYYKLGRAGVCHAILPEQGHIRPGEVIVGGDSHTCTYGALAAFSTGIGSTDLAASIATGKLWFKVPASMKFVLNGSLPHGVYSKDVILAVIGRIGTDGALYRAMEFVGPTLKEMTMEARMTMTNMAIEAGAKNGIIGFDEVTKAYLDAHLKDVKDYTVFESDPDAEYLVDRGVRLLEARADGGPAAPAEQRGAHRRVQGQGDGPGLHRQLHERPDRGPSHRRRDHEGQRGRDPHDRRAGDAGDLEAGEGRRPVRRLLRRRLRDLGPDLRRVPGRLHGHPGRRREVRQHDQPQLRRPHGQSQERSLPGQPRDRRGQRGRRAN